MQRDLLTLLSHHSPSGGTNYEAAFKQAFKMADVSYKQNYDSGCQTVYVFLTDGEQTLGSDGYAGLVQVASVALCCSALQCVAVCCSVLQRVAVCCSVLQCVAVRCSVLQCVAVCCSVLQCVAVCCSAL